MYKIFSLSDEPLLFPAAGYPAGAKREVVVGAYPLTAVFGNEVADRVRVVPERGKLFREQGEKPLPLRREFPQVSTRSPTVTAESWSALGM